MNKLGIYVHIPFCIQKCRYCDFYSLSTGNDAVYAEYVTALTRHFAYVSESARGHTVDSVYFGGGTPSLLPSRYLCDILDRVREYFTLAKDCEITLEMNPKTANEKAMVAYIDSGFNRLSIGCQSAVDSELSMLGRLHTFGDYEETVSMARRAGFANISADLMMGLPNQSLASLGFSIDRIVATDPTHVSVYGLKIEEGTWFGQHRDVLKLPDEDAESEQYLYTVERLAEHGYLQYEISNFCKDGYPSRHNLKYWQGNEYLGFGPAAYSYFAGKRYGYGRSLKDYVTSAVAQNFSKIEIDQEILTEKEMLDERFLLGLRLTQGVRLTEFPLSQRGYELIKRLENEALAVYNNGILSLTPKGMLLDNYITSDLLLCME